MTINIISWSLVAGLKGLTGHRLPMPGLSSVHQPTEGSGFKSHLMLQQQKKALGHRCCLPYCLHSLLPLRWFLKSSWKIKDTVKNVARPMSGNGVVSIKRRVNSLMPNKKNKRWKWKNVLWGKADRACDKLPKLQSLYWNWVCICFCKIKKNKKYLSSNVALLLMVTFFIWTEYHQNMLASITWFHNRFQNNAFWYQIF